MVLCGLRSGAWRDLFAGGLFALLAILFRVEGIVYLAKVVAVLSLYICAGSGRRRQRLQLLEAFSALPVILLLLGGGAILSGMIPPEALARI